MMFLKIQFAALICVVFLFQSCASFINKPSKVEEWQFKEKSNCPKIYKVTSYQVIEYFIHEKHYFTCHLQLDGSGNVGCKKHASHFPDISEKSFTHMHEQMIKDSRKNYPCMIASTTEVDFKFNIKSKVVENLNTAWMFASVFTIGVIPYRGTTETSKTIEILSLKTNKTKILNFDSDSTFWLHLFLLPVMPFIGDGDAAEKILAHENSKIFEAMEALDKTEQSKNKNK